MDITGVIPLLGYVGVVWAAYAVISLFLRILRNSTGIQLPARNNPLTFESISRTFRTLWREDKGILTLLVTTSLVLFVKYFFPNPRFNELGYMFEMLNLPCWLYVILTFHTEDFGKSET